MSHTYSITMAVPDLFREADIEVLFEFEVTSWGSSPSWEDPGDPPEWEITDIFVEGELIPWIRAKKLCPLTKEQRIANALWEDLAEAGQTYIDEHFDWRKAANDYDPTDWY